jgi:drug/metabolite transporter (DMT)-like permease
MRRPIIKEKKDKMNAQDSGHTHKSIMTAILVTCVAYALFNVSDAAVKALLLRYHVSQVFFTNAFIIFSSLAVYGWLREGRKAFRTRKPWQMLLRASLSQVVGVCNMLALPHIRLTTFYTLVFTSPLWVAILSIVVLKDKVDARRIAAVCAGFAAILYIFQPGTSLPSFWMLLVLLGALFYSMQLIVIRVIGKGESRAFMFMAGSFLSISSCRWCRIMRCSWQRASARRRG